MTYWGCLKIDTRNRERRALIENLPDAFAYHEVLTDSGGKPVDYVFLELNPAFEEITGLSQGSIIGKKVTEVHPGIEDSNFDWIGTYGKVALTGESIRFEHYFEIAERWYSITAYSDEPGYFATIFRDMTTSKKERAHQEILLDNIGIQIWYVIDENTYGSVNQAHADFFGVNKEDLENKNIYELMATTKIAKTCIAGNREVFRQKHTIHSEELIRNGSGEERLLSITKTPKLDDNNFVEYVVCSAEDITARKDAELQLERSMQKYSKLVEEAPVGIMTCDNAGVVNYINDPMLIYLGLLGEEDTKEVNLLDFHLLKEVGFSSILQESLRTGEDKVFEIEYIPHSGKPIYARIHISPLKDGELITGAQIIADDMTEQKQSEDDLKQVLDEYDTVFQGTQDAMFLVDVVDSNTFRFIRTNQTHARITGITPELIEQRTPEEILGEEVGGEVAANYRRCLRAAHPISYEETLDLPGGLRIWHTTLTPISYQDKIQYIVGSSQDITKRKQAEEALQDAYIKNQTIIQTSMDAFWLLDASGQFLDANAAYCTMIGYTRKELLNKSIADVEAVERPEEVVRHLEAIVQKGTDHFETRHRCKDGQLIDLEISVNYLSVEGGEYFAFARDITDRKLAEQKLADYAQELADAHQVAQLGRWELDIEANTLLWSPTVYEIFEIDPNKFVPSYDAFIEAIHPDDRQMVEEAYRSSLKDKSPYRIEHRLLMKDSRIKWVFENCRTDFNEQGQPTRSVGIVQDITKHKQAEEQIRYISFHDSLTGLYNRRFLEEEMKRLDTERQLPISIIMIDSNGLKLVNDVYGHDTGDEMLKRAAAIIKESSRKEDIVGRWGGDEFVILLPQAPAKEIRKLQRRIKDNCRGVSIRGVPISLALGSGMKDSAEKKLAAVLKEAEDSMYKQKLTEQQSERSSVLNALLKALQLKSYETEEHTMRMVTMGRKIGRLIGLGDTELDRLSLIITLHDVGETSIPETTLGKEGFLTDEEWESIKSHPEIGYRITRASGEASHVSEDIWAHHERWDGTGYPRGLKGEEIPLLARITAIVDAYEVMSDGRPYQKPMDQEQIMAEMRRCAGTQFDPDLVKVFLSVLEE